MAEKYPTIDPHDGLRFVSHTNWAEVFDTWKNDEDSDSYRREYADAGYATWEEWREKIITPLHLNRLDWNLYELDKPLEIVPTFHGGPFKPWQDRYYGSEVAPTFSDIVTMKGTDVQIRDTFSDILASEKPIRIIGLRLADNIVVIEGMHRSTSIALAALRSQQLRASVSMFLADSDLDNLPTIA